MTLERILRILLSTGEEYTVKELSEKSGYCVSYVRVKLANMQNPDYTKDPIRLQWQRNMMGVRTLKLVNS